MAEKLTPQQAQAVSNRGGRLLVSAAAGSGKTKVLVDRLLSYLTDPRDPANLDEFLIITYTKAAASELRGKIAAKLTQRIAMEPDNRHLQKQMQRLFLTKISTVHGFCSDVLKEYAYRLDLPADFRVADENECRELQDQVLEELLDRAYAQSGEDPAFRAFVDTQGLGRDDRLVPELILKVYHAARCHLNPEQWLEGCLSAVHTEGMTDASQTVWGRYLMDSFFPYLDDQISIMTQCVLEADGCEGFEKPAANLKDTLYMLKDLRACETWDEIVNKRSLDFGRLTFPRKGGDPDLQERIKAARTACKNGLQKRLRSFSDPSRQILKDLETSAGAAEGLIALVRAFSQEYDKLKKTRRVLDFGDLEHRTLDLLLGKSRNSPTLAAEEIGQRFREIMVDEYQDSNGVQDAIFSVLSRGKQNCFMVGDVKQSIYQFRLADPDIFLQKYHTYAPADQAQPGEGRKVLLNANFRSGPEVIEAVNALFSRCMSKRVGGLSYTEEEMLREGVPHGLLPSPGVELCALEVKEDTYQEEAAFVAGKIQKMLASGETVRDGDGFRPVKPEDIVILLRSPGSVGQAYQRALEALGIRCVSGGGMDLLATEEVTAFRSLLQTISNPRQDIPLLSTLMSPVFGFTADDLAALRGQSKKGTIYEAVLASDLPQAEAFREILGELRQEARRSTLTQLLQKCLSETRLDSIFAAMSGGEARRANLQTFFQLAADYEGTGIRDLNQFLEHLDALEERGMLAASEGGAGSVTIMSIHKSKGLEFPVVFLCGLAREFNRESLRQQILCDKDLGLGLSVTDPEKRIRYPSISKAAIAVKMTEESLSEEMRVLYVAVTRARDRLIMVYSPRNLQSSLQDIALRMDFDGGRLLCQDVSCPGQWVMLAAMGRTEAGALHKLSARPRETQVSELPWKISLVEAEDPESRGGPEKNLEMRSIPQDAEQVLRQALSFRYPFLPATQAPSKQTATGRKGREKDEEIALNAPEPKKIVRKWRDPSFRGGRKEGRAYGTAIHAAMQYLDFSRCGSLQGVNGELERIVSQGFLSREQGELVEAKKIWPFFQSEMGEKLIGGCDCLREFKFSILDDAVHYGEGLQGEQVLLQGVVDCALIEDDGITVLDFKTDYVTGDTLKDLTEHYRLQIQTYADALMRIYEMPVKASYLYFFHLNRFVKL